SRPTDTREKPKPPSPGLRTPEVTAVLLSCGLGLLEGILGSAMSASPRPRLEFAMERFAAGDDAALAEVYDLGSPAVFSFLMGLCRDRQLAEDLTQETF